MLPPETIESHLRLVQGAFARELEALIRDRMHHARDAAPPGESDERIEFVAVVLGNAIAGAMLGGLDIWTRRGGGAPEELEAITAEALEILRGFPLG